MKIGSFNVGLFELIIVAAFLLVGVLPYYVIEQTAPKIMMLGYAAWMSTISFFLWKR